MPKQFVSSSEAEKWFLKSLEERDFIINEVRPIRIRSGRGKIITQKLAITNTGDAFEIAFWSKLYQLVRTEDLRENFARERDKKLKNVLKTFGHGTVDVLGIQMSVILELMEMENEGFVTHLVFLIKDGRVFWCRVADFYNFVTRYDSYLIHAPTYGGEFCIVPIGWLYLWDQPLSAPGCIGGDLL